MQYTEDVSSEPRHNALLSVFGRHKLHPSVWKPTEAAKGLVYVCHGVGEHMGRYEELASHLAQNGIIAFGHDHVGHGQSEGDRVHVEDVDTYVQDVIHHVELMKNEYPHLPCILMGHSMGGLVASHTAIQRSDLFASLILSGMAAEFDAKFSIWIVKKVFQWLSHVAPQLGVRYIDTNDISSIPEEVERYVNDPLIWHGGMKARWGVAMVSSITLLRESVATISLPLLLIHGSEDHLVPISSSHFINDNVSSQEKKFEVFEGSRHEVLHDKEQERARELIKDWVLAHLAAAPVPGPQSAEPEDLAKAQTAAPCCESQPTSQQEATTEEEVDSSTATDQPPPAEEPGSGNT